MQEKQLKTRRKIIIWLIFLLISLIIFLLIYILFIPKYLQLKTNLNTLNRIYNIYLKVKLYEKSEVSIYQYNTSVISKMSLGKIRFSLKKNDRHSYSFIIGKYYIVSTNAIFTIEHTNGVTKVLLESGSFVASRKEKASDSDYEFPLENTYTNPGAYHLDQYFDNIFKMIREENIRIQKSGHFDCDCP